MFVRFILLIVLIAFVVGLAAHPSGSAGKPLTYVVQPSDTLWTIATKRYAGDPREAIWKLQRRNHLHGTTLVPGQKLVLP